MKFSEGLPILVTGFNRPQLLYSVLCKLEELQARNIWLFVDGPRSSEIADNKGVIACRKLASQFAKLVEDRVFFPNTNLGCKFGMYQAITWFFNHNSAGVVLEDDLTFEADFLAFVENNLNIYRDDLTVGSIAGYMPLTLSHRRDLSDQQAVRHPFFSAWGWGSWANRWGKIDIDMKHWRRDLSTLQLIRRTRCLSIPYWRRRFESLSRGTIDTWDFQFLFTHFVYNWDVVAPISNLVGNVGFGDLATHTKRVREIPPITSLESDRGGTPQILERKLLKTYLLKQFGI